MRRIVKTFKGSAKYGLPPIYAWVGEPGDYDGRWDLEELRQRPIEEVDGETPKEWRARDDINRRWLQYEEERVRMGLPITLPWGGSKQPEQGVRERAERPRRPAPPQPKTAAERRVRDARQKD